MKKLFIALVAIIATISMTSCSSKNEKIAKQYVEETEMPKMVLATSLLNGEVKSFTIDNFDNTPFDTLYEWEVFEKYDLAISRDTYINSMKILTDTYRDMTTFDYYDKDMIAEEEAQAKKDSVSFDKAQQKLNTLKKNNDVHAIGYAFSVNAKIKLAGNTQTKTIYYYIYINNDGTVFECNDIDNYDWEDKLQLEEKIIKL